MGMFQGHILQVMLVGLFFVHVTYSGQDLLLAPKNISMVSINLKHILHWHPIPVTEGNVTYSVETQGEYEHTYMKELWHDADQCQSISAHQCSVSKEVSANVLYRFRVRSELGDQKSAWAELEQPFNRKTSILIPPRLNLQVNELNLVANIEDYGPSFQFFVFFWQKGKEEQVKSIKTNRHATSTFLAVVVEGNEYCAEVIACAIPISKNSSKSNPVCVQVKALNHPGLFIGLLCMFGVLVAFVPLTLVGWKAFGVMQYSCCPDVEIPDVLKEPGAERMVKNFSSGQDKCEQINSVELHEPIFSEETRHSFTAKTQML